MPCSQQAQSPVSRCPLPAAQDPSMTPGDEAEAEDRGPSQPAEQRPEEIERLDDEEMYRGDPEPAEGALFSSAPNPSSQSTHGSGTPWLLHHSDTLNWPMSAGKVEPGKTKFRRTPINPGFFGIVD